MTFESEHFGDSEEYLEDYPGANSIFMAELDDAMQHYFTGTPWEQRISVFTESTPWEERIALYQAFRAEQVFPEEPVYFLIAWAIEAMAEEHIDEMYDAKFAARYEKIRKTYNITEEDEWEPGTGPKEYEALNEELHQATEAIARAAYQKFGELKMLELLEHNPEEADRIYEVGFEFIDHLIDEHLVEEPPQA